ncbi:MAG: hypothetical protein JNM81_04605 [Rhodospirillaceae bacterium]|nr:hypothetical protein [Rhodospirillaceae bacterium]
MLRRLFQDHPASVGESYGQHAGFAFGVGVRMVGAGLACMLHGLLPFLFVNTGSQCIRQLNDNLGGRGQKTKEPQTMRVPAPQAATTPSP